jgi:hypothetical protein
MLRNHVLESFRGVGTLILPDSGHSISACRTSIAGGRSPGFSGPGFYREASISSAGLERDFTPSK